MPKHKNQNKIQQQVQEQIQQQSVLSSEDDDGVLLTSKVQQKLLSTLARIKMRDPSLYEIKTPLYQQSDFQISSNSQEIVREKANKFTYKDMMRQSDHSADEQQKQLAPKQQQKRAKQRFKKALSKNIQILAHQQDDLFTIKAKVAKPQKLTQQVDEKSKFKDLTKSFNKQNKKIIKKVWKSEELDQTDLFLKKYILDKKWLTSKYKEDKTEEQEQIDEEDQERSQEMDKFQATYNFRFQQPGGTQITQYPRAVRHSLRQKPQTRKEKRKKMIQKKKQEQDKIRKQAEQKKENLKRNILQNLMPEEQNGGHDWFFCDDCCKPLQEGEKYFQCQECEDYMLCSDCNELIIHKHKLNKSKIPKGSGPPNTSLQVLHELKTCKMCRRRIVPTKKRYQFLDKTYVLNTMCQQCFDESNLDIKKKYKQVDPQILNYQQILQQNPQKIIQLTNKAQIQEMVNEYLKTQFQDVIAGGLKTKFKYMSVPAESYGLSDEQILYGDDKELNKYISIKKLAPYQEGNLRLRNSIFNQKIKTIKKSVKVNKKLLQKGIAKFNKIRLLDKVKNRASAVKQRRQKRLRILNLSNKQRQRNFFIPNSRLQSYGIKKDQEDGR